MSGAGAGSGVGASGVRTIGDAATSFGGVMGKADCGAGAVAQPASASTNTTPVIATLRLIEPPSKNRIAFSVI
jgi:hypothetical protein